MNHFAKIAKTTALAVTSVGFIAVASATPSAARDFPWAAAGAGFAAGAVVGSAAANNGYWGPGYAYSPGYAAYGYSPGYARPGPVYSRSTTVYRSAPAYQAYASVEAPTVGASRSCWRVTDNSRGYGYWGSCAAPPLTFAAREKAKNSSD